MRVRTKSRITISALNVLPVNKGGYSRLFPIIPKNHARHPTRRIDVA